MISIVINFSMINDGITAMDCKNNACIVKWHSDVDHNTTKKTNQDII